LEPITALITPETSKDEGTNIAFSKIPQGFVVSYLDEDDNYTPKEVEVYRSGFSSSTATDVLTRKYNGITLRAKAEAQAEFELGQLFYRNIEFRRIVHRDGRFYVRGQKLGISDNVINEHHYLGLIKEVLSSGTDVTGLVLYGSVKLSRSAGQIGMSEDFLSESDATDISTVFGAAVRLKNGTVITNRINEVVDTDTITFTIPIDNTDGLFDVDQPVGIGPLDSETTEVILKHKEFVGEEQWRLILVPVANELFL